MEIVYICGAYRAKTRFGRLLNIYRARKVAIKYWKLGFAVMCPHMNSFFFDGKASDETFLKGYLKFVGLADVIVMLPGWLFSEGSQAEHRLAAELGKKIIYLSPTF